MTDKEQKSIDVRDAVRNCIIAKLKYETKNAEVSTKIATLIEKAVDKELEKEE